LQNNDTVNERQRIVTISALDWPRRPGQWKGGVREC
jgi:hypothetical protein